MKKCFSFLVLILVASNVFAQNKGFEIGVEGGFNVSYPYKNQDYAMQSPSNYIKPGFAIGLTNNLIFTKHSALYVGVLYEQKTVMTTEWSVRDMYAYDYATATKNIIIPVMYRYFFCSGKKVNAFFNLGPSLGFSLWQKYTHYPAPFVPNLTTETTTNFKFNINAAIGAGIKINLNNHLSLHAELRQLILLQQVKREADFSQNNTVNFGTSYILTGLSYRLGK